MFFSLESDSSADSNIEKNPCDSSFWSTKTVLKAIPSLILMAGAFFAKINFST